MGTAIESRPRFQVGDWVSFLFGTRRLIVPIIEDRGTFGPQARRLYRVIMDETENEPITAEIPEEDLEPPPLIRTAKAARDRGFSTQNWPRQGFNFEYVRQQDTNHWKTKLKRGRGLTSGKAVGAVAYSTAGWASDPARGHEPITVFVEFDPRLSDPEDEPEIWAMMKQDAQKLADETFKSHHPKAVIDHSAAH